MTYDLRSLLSHLYSRKGQRNFLYETVYLDISDYTLVYPTRKEETIIENLENKGVTKQKRYKAATLFKYRTDQIMSRFPFCVFELSRFKLLWPRSTKIIKYMLKIVVHDFPPVTRHLPARTSSGASSFQKYELVTCGQKSISTERFVLWLPT